MTMTAPTYRALRSVVEQCTDFVQLNSHQLAIFWREHGGTRLLLFNHEFLVWTEWRPTREQAVDAALQAAGKVAFR